MALRPGEPNPISRGRKGVPVTFSYCRPSRSTPFSCWRRSSLPSCSASPTTIRWAARVGWDLENFERFFTGDRSLQIFWNTLCFAIFAVAGNVTVGLLLALALNRAMPSFLLYLFRLAYFLPVIIAAAFVSIVWGYFYGDDLGVINYYLIRLGFAPVHWLTSSRTAMMSIILMDVWKNAGFFMIIFIAALQGVPKSIMDAAIMDEPSYWRRFFRIVLPWISPVVFFAIVYASIGALQVYESIVILTQGGPGDATRSMSITSLKKPLAASRSATALRSLSS